MVFIKNDHIPISSMNPFILSFNTASVIFSKEVLKRTKADNWLCLVKFIRSDTSIICKFF